MNTFLEDANLSSLRILIHDCLSPDLLKAPYQNCSTVQELHDLFGTTQTKTPKRASL